MLRWEYNTIVDSVENMSQSILALDEAGRDGWEVIAVSQNNYGITYLMKKPLPSLDATKAVVEEPVKHNHSVSTTCRSTCPQQGTVHEITWSNVRN